MKKQSTTSFLKKYYSKEHHTRAENAIYKNIMQDFYSEYKKSYHTTKIKVRSFTTEKYSFSDFKNVFKMEFTNTETPARSALAVINKESNFQVLQNKTYKKLFKNFKENYKKIDKNMPLSPTEQLIVDYYEKHFAGRKGNIPMTELYKLVDYFERLGTRQETFDS